MKKKFLAAILVLLALIIVFASSALADSKKSGLFTYEIKGNGTAVITGFDWNSNGNEDVYIPRMLDGYTVTEVGEYAFSSESASLDNFVGNEVVVVIPDTISIIGDKAFFCTKIESANIPASVQLIGAGAFSGCANIKEFYVDDGNSTYATISGVLFNKVKKELVAYPFTRTEYYTVPTGISSIGAYAFYGVDWEKSDNTVKFANSITNIGDYAFAETAFNYKRYHPIVLPSELISIGDYAFYNSKMWIIQFNEKLQTIGDYAFSGAYITDNPEHTNMNHNGKVLTLPNSVQEIGEGSFASLNSFHGGYAYINLKKTQIAEIPPYAFSNTHVGKLYLPDSLKIIRNNSMAEMLGFVDIPASVEYIEDEAFLYGGGNITFAYESKLKSIGARTFKNYHFNGQGTLNLPSGIEEIGSEAFFSTADLELLVIPNSVKSIGSSLCDRADVTLQVESGSYAAIYASENGYTIKKAGGDDTSWLNS